jgi:hypothetical protein
MLPMGILDLVGTSDGEAARGRDRVPVNSQVGGNAPNTPALLKKNFGESTVRYRLRRRREHAPDGGGKDRGLRCIQ